MKKPPPIFVPSDSGVDLDGLRIEPGKVRWADDWQGPPPKLWLIALLFALGYFLYSLTAHAKTEIRCHWQTCSVIQGSLSACGGTHSGSTDEMLSAERQERGRGKLFLRECVLAGEETELKWASGPGIFMREERAP
jgi:hypothetical protein